MAEGGLEALGKSVPGPAPKLSADQKRIAQLEKQIVRLEKDLHIKDQCIDLQKKVLAMIEQLEQESAQQ